MQFYFLLYQTTFGCKTLINFFFNYITDRPLILFAVKYELRESPWWIAVDVSWMDWNCSVNRSCQITRRSICPSNLASVLDTLWRAIRLT